MCREYGIEPRDPLYLGRTSKEASKL
jgi:hypothetical protein